MLSGILIAIVPGWINGLLIAKVKVTSFIVTLGMGFIVEGASLISAKGQTVAQQPPYWAGLGNGSLLLFLARARHHVLSTPDTATAAEFNPSSR